MKKIIFLDIDGVLNSEEWYKSNYMNGNIDPKAIKLLNTLNDGNTSVVISSSWGQDGVEVLPQCGLILPILGCTKKFHTDWTCRGNEIARWLFDTYGNVNSFSGEVYGEDVNYVIIDDDTDMLMSQKDNFVQTDRMTGFVEKDLELVNKILGNK